MASFVRGVLAMLVLAAGLAVAIPAVASAAPTTGHVYVDNNTGRVNTVSGFDRHSDGTLSPIPGSPFAAGGVGTGTGIPSQGAIQIAGRGRYVLAVDAGSDEVSVMRIKRNGSLRLVRVVSSGGLDPVSVAVHDGLIYVANAGAGGSNYTGFRLNSGGRLVPLARSTFVLPDDAQPGDVLFNSSGTNLIGIRVGPALIDSFSVGPDGRLTAAPDSPFAAQGPGPFGSEFRPTEPSQLFISNAHGGAGNGTVSGFSVASDGALSSIGSSPFADFQTAPCWVEITRDGDFLFTVNTASGSISRFAIATDGTLTLLGSTQIGATGAGAVDARLSIDGGSLYVNESAAGRIGEFAVSGGDLTLLGSVSVPTGPGAAGLAVN